MLLFLTWSFDRLYTTPPSHFLIVDFFLKEPLHIACIHGAFPVENTDLWEAESMQLWKALPPWVRETQARPEINIIELKKWKPEIHIPDMIIFLLKCIFPSDNPNSLTFIPSWKCYPEAGKAEGPFSYPFVLYS